MQLDQYNIYSTLSLNKGKSESELLQVLEQVEKLKEIDNIDFAKNYLRDVWNVEKDVKNYSLCDKCILNVTESEKAFCINFVYENKNKTYYYEK